MSRLHRVSPEIAASAPASARGAVVFVHGLSGDAFESWQRGDDGSTFWPAWLAADLPDAAVYTLEYEAAASNWFGSAMQLPDRATDVLAELVSHGLDRVPVTFICHSLGGLVVKQVLRVASDQRAATGDGLFNRTRGIVFLGTPNMGSHLSNWADRFRGLVNPSEATASLAANDASLRDLNLWYRDHCGDAGIATMACFETRPTHGVMVVEAMSADPGIPGVMPLPIDADHIGICKPASRDTTLYRTVRRFVEDAFHDSKMLSGGTVVADRQDVTEELDVFISHSSTQKEWVETLADNLQRAGKSVFLDLWRLVPGRDFIEGLRAGLASCRSAILVVSPEALQSGWVREEYELLKRRQAKDPNFTIVPIIHSGVETGSPFFGSIQSVDFRDRGRHLESFARLLAGLEGRPPGYKPTYDTRIFTTLPDVVQRPIAEAGRRTIAQAFSKLFNAPLVVILVQDGVGSTSVAREIKKHAIEKFGENTVHHLAPSYVTAKDGLPVYFESLLAQMSLSTEQPSPLAFQRQVGKRLASGESMCLVFTGIEHSPAAALEALCGALRALTEIHERLRVLMCGGERLCEMRYAKGHLSLLSHAQEQIWPEAGLPEIQAEASAQDCGTLDPELLTALQELTGGHFGVLRELLNLVRAGEHGRDALMQAVLDSPTIWAAVAPLRDDEAANRFLGTMVDRDDLGEAERYIRNPTLRRIYWKNLIARRPGNRLQLVWRSKAINEAVRRIVRGG